MANPHKGEIDISADGVMYRWRFSVNAICVLEEQTGRGLLDISRELLTWAPASDDKGVPLPETAEQQQVRLGRIRMGFVRSVFWAGFTDAHPEMTPAMAGDLIAEVGGLPAALALITEGMNLAVAGAEASGTPRPPNRAARRKIAAGTGPAS